METRMCKRCGETKDFGDFEKHKQCRHGITYTCRACAVKISCQWAANNKRASLLIKKRWRVLHPDKQKQVSREHRERNRDQLNARQREYERNNPHKKRAHACVRRALRSGKLVRPTKCQKCGSEKGGMQAHHEDYSTPLSVKWLCSMCHINLHLAYKW